MQTSFYIRSNYLLLLCTVLSFHQPRLVHTGGIISSCNSFAIWVMLFLWLWASLQPCRLRRLCGWPPCKQKSSAAPFGAMESKTTSPSSPRKEQDEILRVGLILFPNKWHLESQSPIGRLCLLFSIVLKFTRMGKDMNFLCFARDFVRETHAHTETRKFRSHLSLPRLFLQDACYYEILKVPCPFLRIFLHIQSGHSLDM